MYSKSILTFCLIILFISACRKDRNILKTEGTLNFTKDIVYFDTVFTRLPGSPYPRSINKRFMVLNPYNETVNVNVVMGKGASSEFRMNVDGKSGIVSTLEILPKDSAWIFVEATLEPNFLKHPALVRDSIIFETNGHLQHVKLAAYGWDAYYFKDTVLDPAITNWTLTDKPYVIVNSCFVDENKTLNIGPGVHVYNTTNSFLPIIKNIHALNVLGTLKINGTQSNPVIFEGDRLDNNYANVPGQWQGIGFFRTSKDNEINHAIIKNATYGVRVDSLSNNLNPKLKLKNCIIKNMSGVGILGRTGDIYAENTVVSNCTQFWFFGQMGGKYEFYHCSMNNVTAASKDPHWYLTDQLRNDQKVVVKVYPLAYIFKNCILYGPATENELGFDFSVPHNPNIEYSLLKYKDAIGLNNIFSEDPQFENAAQNYLKIKLSSPAKDKGFVGLPITTDIEDKPRSDGKPDMGAYEAQ